MRTQIRGTNEQEYEIYRAQVIKMGWTAKSFNKWLTGEEAVTIADAPREFKLEAEKPNPHERRTIKATVQHYRNMLGTNRGWAVKGMLKIYDMQTAEEQNSETTLEDNGVGFTGVDAEILSSFSQQFQDKKWLSNKQMRIVFARMPKYARQLYNLTH